MCFQGSNQPGIKFREIGLRIESRGAGVASTVELPRQLVDPVGRVLCPETALECTVVLLKQYPDLNSLNGAGVVDQSLGILLAGTRFRPRFIVDDADADLTNELIDDEAFTLTGDTILTLSEAGIEHSINLASLRDDGDWKVDEDDNVVYNENQRIGIGTNSPSARLELIEETNSVVALRVVSGDETLLHAENERLGIGTTSASSRVQFGGSVGYDVTVLSTEETDNYTATIEDHMIVVNFQAGGNSEFGIFLPPADVCAGRVYLIRKTGALGSIGDLTIDTSGFQIDFDDPDLVLDEGFPETAVLLSLGNDGWTRIFR